MGENWQLLSPIRLSKSGCIWLKGVQNRHNGVIVWTQTELQLSRKTFFLFPLKRNTLVTFLHEIFIKLVTICVCVVGQVPWLCDSSCECIRIWQQVESPLLGVYWLVHAGWHLHRKAKILSPFSSLSPTPLLRSISFLTSLWHASCNTIIFYGVMPSVSSVEEALTFHSHIVPPWTSHLSPSCPFSFWNLQLTKCQTHLCSPMTDNSICSLTAVKIILSCFISQSSREWERDREMEGRGKQRDRDFINTINV